MKRMLARVAPLALAAAVMCAPLAAAGAATYLLLSPQQPAVGHLGVYVTGEKEILLDVAREHGFGYTEFMTANRGVDPWFPPEGTSVVLPGFHILPDAPRRGVVVNLAAQRLFYFPAGGVEVITFPIGISRPGLETPTGATQVVRKTVNPVWYPTPGARAEDPSLPASVPPGPDNPLGRFALYLGWDRYLIHGTNKPDGIGRTVSRGCLRLYPEDIERLYRLVPVGTPVHVVSQEAVTAWIGNTLYAQVYPTKNQAEEIGMRSRFTTHAPSTELVERVAVAAEARGAAIDWKAVERAGLERTGLPVPVARALPPF